MYQQAQLENENSQTIVKTIKNMIHDFMDSKKTEFQNDEERSSSPGDEIDNKVQMSDTDEDGSQISPI